VELLDRAAACAVSTGFPVVGTPHVIAAGLEFDEPLQRAVTDCGHDPARLLEMLLNALNAPRAISPFSPAHIEDKDERPPLSRNVYLALTRAARGIDEGARLESSALLASVLTQTSGSVATLLQSQGVEPHEIAMALQSGV
jgi:hypothetical protein